jgi:poly-gamma-glutamate synthesis protein (capsule biosynthesis protein)
MLDTIENFRRLGIQTTGAGRNLQEARQPAIVERKGVRVAFLAYCSIIKEGYAAGPNRAGVAPMRAHTYYQPIDAQPGIPARPVTIPYESDLQAMVEDITNARKTAHAVVVSMHWGVHFIPKIIADYQTTVAQAAFAAGADLILGHHAHVPKAVGVHGGKVCFYSLSNFIMSSPPFNEAQAKAFCRKYGVTLDPDYPLLRYGADANRSLIAKAIISSEGVKRVSFLPVLIDKQLRPEALRRDDPRFEQALRFMEDASSDFDHNFVAEGDEILVS